MTGWQWLVLAAAATLAVYGGFVAWLLVSGRREDARGLAGFIPDCVTLLRRLIADPRVPRRAKLLLLALITYLALPFDVVPDFIPIAGQLDDLIVAAAVIGAVLRAGGPELIREHWPGPAGSLNVLLRRAYGRAATAASR